ncbi:hypothetical protein [Vibrio rarus]|uniref:hypothetical protein n=1 Tax=Vibrio rarus TaxID=413403 RepID=UPI0021C38560|nr:hypothetical protein [Vibrio rarus]
MIELTEHAKLRSQQRGITPDCIEVLNMFGCEIKHIQGAISLELDHREKKRLRRVFKACMQLVEKDNYAIVSERGIVITVAHKLS